MSTDTDTSHTTSTEQASGPVGVIRRIKEIALRNQLPVFSSFGILFLGILFSCLSALPADRWAQFVFAFGGMMGASLGALLLSYYYGKVESSHEALQHVRPRLESVSRLAGDIRTQLHDVLKSAAEGTSSDVCYARVKDAENALSNCVDEIQAILGKRFDPTPRVTIRQILNAMHQDIDMASTAIEQGDNETAAENLNNILRMWTGLTEAVGDAGESSEVTSTAEIECPYCDNVVEVEIEDDVGASAAPKCHSCGRRFHAHRDKGGLFAKKWYVSESNVKGSAKCPVCANAVPYTADADRNTLIERYCLSNTCFTLCKIDPYSGEVREHESSPPLDGQALSKYLMECPTCNGRYQVIYRNFQDRKMFSVCTKCSRLVRTDFVA